MNTNIPDPASRPWSAYSAAELDKQVNARATVDDIMPIVGRYAEGSKEAKIELECELDIPYGPHPDETLDVFPSKKPGSPVFVFIHGGYWRMLSKDDSSFMAPCFVEAGCTVVAVNYQLSPDASIDEIVRQVRAAMAWVYKNIAAYNGDPNAIHVSGSSAGGHLVGMVLSKGWHESFGVPLDLIKSASPISGLFELTPLIDTHVNAWAKLDAESAHRLSPQFHLPDKGCPIVVSYGETETAEFMRQSNDYVAAWQAAGFSATYVPMPGTNHFDIILRLNDPDSVLTRAIFTVMGLGMTAV